MQVIIMSTMINLDRSNLSILLMKLAEIPSLDESRFQQLVQFLSSIQIILALELLQLQQQMQEEQLKKHNRSDQMNGL